MKKTPILTLCLIASIMAGCAAPRSGEVYSREQALQQMYVQYGVVESVREVKLEGTNTGVGTLAGAAIGGVAGSSVGAGKGNIVGAIAGAVIGGIAGSAIEEGTTHKNALEITVRLENDRIIAVVQEGAESFRVGDRVRVLTGRGTTRISR